jgi:hypothetical protein
MLSFVIHIKHLYEYQSCPCRFKLVRHAFIDKLLQFLQMEYYIDIERCIFLWIFECGQDIRSKQ